LYADDAKIYKVVNQIADQADLQAVLRIVENWSDEWLSRLNIDNCKFVSYYLKNPIRTQYYIEHENSLNMLDKLDSINDFGVLFDSNLSFRDNISQKINKAYSILGIIKRNFIYLDERSSVLLYKFMVRTVPHPKLHIVSCCTKSAFILYNFNLSKSLMGATCMLIPACGVQLLKATLAAQQVSTCFSLLRSKTPSQDPILVNFEIVKLNSVTTMLRYSMKNYFVLWKCNAVVYRDFYT